MTQKKVIAIVGATEPYGRQIAAKLSQGNYSLLLISNKKEELDDLSKIIADNKPKAEINFIECVKDGCWEADIIVLTVPFGEKTKVAEMMKEVATQKTVVVISDEKNPDEDLRTILPYSKLVIISNFSSSKEIVIRGNDDTANEEISMIFNQDGCFTKMISHNKKFKINFNHN